MSPTCTTALVPTRNELILGGQKSGKPSRAEGLARQWLDADLAHRTVLIATAHAGDEEMRQRIARHQADRARRVPGMSTIEEPLQLAQAITRYSRLDTLLVVDCLTLWLTNLMLPAADLAIDRFWKNSPADTVATAQAATPLIAIENTPGPLVLVSNEIGLGVIPLGAPVRAFVDALGTLDQQVAALCQRVTLMAAGLPLALKDAG